MNNPLTDLLLESGGGGRLFQVDLVLMPDEIMTEWFWTAALLLSIRMLAIVFWLSTFLVYL